MWSDACRAIHAALVCGGVDAEDAVRISMHSFKHLYPTMGRQLGLSDSQVASMGNWASGDPMPGVYDSVACSTSLVYKEHVRTNVCAGWTLATIGNAPQDPVVLLGQRAAAAAAAAHAAEVLPVVVVVAPVLDVAPVAMPIAYVFPPNHPMLPPDAPVVVSSDGL